MTEKELIDHRELRLGNGSSFGKLNQTVRKKVREMDTFKANLESYFKDFFSIVATKDGDWTVKGFIDVYKNIYTISLDTKVVSKIIELMIFPVILKFASDNDYEMILTSHQNHYPDISFVSKKTKKRRSLSTSSQHTESIPRRSMG